MSKTELSNESIAEFEIPYEFFQYLSSGGHDFQNICRICLSICESALYPLFTSKNNRIILDTLVALTNLKINEDDGLPSGICVKCQEEILSCFDLKNKCLKSDYTLKSVIKEGFTFSQETAYDCWNSQSEVISKENVRKLEDIGEDINSTDIDYLQSIKDCMSDDEALCIVGETSNNKKKITIFNNNDLKTFQEINVENKFKKKNSKKLKHFCTLCPKKFRKLKSLRAHTSKRHTESNCPFPCDKCKEAFYSEFDLGLHGMLHAPGPTWTCSQCQKLFHGKPALRRHIQRHMQSKRFRCESCGKSFVELYALRRHARVHTGERPAKTHACRYCDNKYSSRSSLCAHEARHRGECSLQCSCGKVFASARLLASHRRVHSDDKPHVCHHCGKGFRHESTRNTHVRTHTGERPFSCARCGKTFIQRSNMTLHMRTHTGEKPYSCPFCDRKFSSGSTLKAHKRTHTGERPYSCNICGKSFARVNMKLHMRLHTGERPHQCSVCLKRFTSAPRLRDHARTHTGEKPFECALCTDKFATKSHLIKHVRAHEKNKATMKGVVMEPVIVSDKSLHNTVQIESKPTEYMFVEQTTNAPNILPSNLCTVQTAIQPAQELLYQDNSDVKTEVIVLGTEQNLVTNGVTYINDLNCSNNVKLVAVNEEEMRLTGSAVEGTTVKLYQYDQSLLEIHSGTGHVTISRISSKMTTNF